MLSPRFIEHLLDEAMRADREAREISHVYNSLRSQARTVLDDEIPDLPTRQPFDQGLLDHALADRLRNVPVAD